MPSGQRILSQGLLVRYQVQEHGANDANRQLGRSSWLCPILQLQKATFLHWRPFGALLSDIWHKLPFAAGWRHGRLHCQSQLAAPSVILIRPW